MEGVHGHIEIDIWKVGFPWMHGHWRWDGYHIKIERQVWTFCESLRDRHNFKKVEKEIKDEY